MSTDPDDPAEGDAADMIDRGPDFDAVRVGRPAAGALADAGYSSLDDLPADLESLLDLHGVGPKAVRLLAEARHSRRQS